MKRYLEFESGDDPNLLTRGELMSVIKILLGRVYTKGVGDLLYSTLEREKDPEPLSKMVSELFKIAKEKKGIDTVTVTYDFPPEPADTKGLEYKMEKIESETTPGKFYVLQIVDGMAQSCTCPSFNFNYLKGSKQCKHTRKFNIDKIYAKRFQ